MAIYHKPGGKKPRWPLYAAVAGIAVLLCAVVALRAWHSSTANNADISSVPISSESSSAPPPSTTSYQQPAGQSEGQPEEQAPAMELTFTGEETAMLDDMLAAWAADTYQSVVADEETGEESTVTTGSSVSVFFMDLESGLSYVYNGEEKYLIASLNKAPYAQYLYTLVDDGTASLDETFHVTHAMLSSVQGNTGRIKDDETLPRDYTLEELIYELIRYSDTGALKILLERYGADGYIEWASGLGLHFPEDIRGITNARITALDAGVYLQALYQYMHTGGEASRLKEHMLNTRNAMITSEYPVARKYGWDVSSYHDMAVVFSPHPYVLAILTDKSAGTAADTAKFSEIAQTFETLFAEKWQAIE